MRTAHKGALLTHIGEQPLSLLNEFLEFVGNLGLFDLRAARRVFLPPFECLMIC
jgi:hypothetical protein